MNREELKKVQKNLEKKGLIDDYTMWVIDNELQDFLENKLKKNTRLIKMLIEEKKSLEGNNNLKFSFF